jgi:hypothetical protein
MAMNRFHLLALPVALGAVALAACGGGDSAGRSGHSDADFRQAALRHARCMREHGIDVPDPKFGPNGSVDLVIPRNAGGKQAIASVENACRKYLEAARGPAPSADEQRHFREGALRQARCMRENGIDMPDPTFSARGAEMRFPKGVGPENPRFVEAQRKCAKYDPKAAMRSADK